MDNTKERQAAEAFLSQALDIGQYMLQSGGEISRVEDSLHRLCMAYGVERVEVFAITSWIVVTITGKNFGSITQSRRASGNAYDLDRLERLNALCRRICNQKLSRAEIQSELEAIRALPPYSRPVQFLTYALVSLSFCLFFGGTVGDAVASALIGVALKWVESVIRATEANAFLSALLCSSLGGFLAALMVLAGLGAHVGLINIGNVMLLIPGIAIINSLRDMFSGNTVSGMLRFMEAVIMALVIALGFALGASVLL